MDLPAPIHLGGRYDLTAVSVGRDRESYVYCSDDCLREWLCVFPAT